VEILLLPDLRHRVMLGVDVLVGPRSEVQGSRIRHHDASRLQEAIASNEQSFAPFLVEDQVRQRL
jgi:hypothetical protein